MIDKILVKETIRKGLLESKESLNYVLKTMGRENFYRMIFDFPKKWSKRKIKKKGDQKIELLRLEYGIEVAKSKVHNLGPEYSTIFSEDEKETK